MRKIGQVAHLDGDTLEVALPGGGGDQLPHLVVVEVEVVEEVVEEVVVMEVVAVKRRT